MHFTEDASNNDRFINNVVNVSQSENGTQIPQSLLNENPLFHNTRSIFKGAVRRKKYPNVQSQDIWVFFRMAQEVIFHISQ